MKKRGKGLRSKESDETCIKNFEPSNRVGTIIMVEDLHHDIHITGEILGRNFDMHHNTYSNNYTIIRYNLFNKIQTT
jgi:hypothetical protein